MPQRFKKGDRVQLLTDIDYRPWTILRAGERGLVLEVFSRTDEPVPRVILQMDSEHEGLAFYDNKATIVPPELASVTVLDEPEEDLPYIAPLAPPALLPVERKLISEIAQAEKTLEAALAVATKRQHRYTRAWNALIGVALFTAGWMVEPPWKSFLTPASASHAYNLTNPHLEFTRLSLGQPLEVIWTLETKGTCLGTADRFWFNRAGDVISKQEGIALTPHTDAQPHEHEVHIPVPPGFAPGHYSYQSVAYPECDGIKQVPIISKLLEFEIVDYDDGF